MTDDHPGLMLTSQRALENIGSLAHEEKTIKDFVKAKIAEIKLWQDTELLRLEKARMFHMEQVRQTALGLGLHTAKRRSASVPGGRFGYRKAGAKIEITDDSKAIEWCQTRCPEAVGQVITITIDKKKILSYVTKVGEYPETGDGIVFHEPTDNFYVTPKEDS